MSRLLVIVALSVLLAFAAVLDDRPATAQDVEFTEDYLNNEANIERGQELWRQQCAKCHGASSYPGKAPKLEPDRLSPREIYLKTTFGFGKMPAWEDIFTDEERKAVTAFIKSDIFSP